MDDVAHRTRTERRVASVRASSPGLSLSVAGILVAAVAAVVVTFAYGPRTDVEVRYENASLDRLAAIDGAIRRGDLKAARAEWNDTYRSLLRNPDWRQMAALGDAALVIGGTLGVRDGGKPDARRAYLGALFRARAAGSVDGVLRVTGAFAALGDRDVVDEGLRIAESLAKRAGDTAALERVLTTRTRLQNRDPMTGQALHD
jgi:hypothetical protein